MFGRLLLELPGREISGRPLPGVPEPGRLLLPSEGRLLPSDERSNVGSEFCRLEVVGRLALGRLETAGRLTEGRLLLLGKRVEGRLGEGRLADGRLIEGLRPAPPELALARDPPPKLPLGRALGRPAFMCPPPPPPPPPLMRAPPP
ncbi:hypothetical protein [Blastopirellula marina]|uniref:Uncharacterized protein n=1 Tax=Blastopirellula marina DSM 3645 TaxID=314230 RepID=A3ZR66_9BACT|nr:hypothetical protein [Blastopirellula marina]EAQ81159.1 hypothetical protein DSM3645_21347 [Blastopirellula marina DSM 3645]